jgi:hypothetical protein
MFVAVWMKVWLGALRLSWSTIAALSDSALTNLTLKKKVNIPINSSVSMNPETAFNFISNNLP